MLKVSSLKDGDDTPADPEAGMNRKEREAMEAQRAKEAYMKKHLAGETEQVSLCVCVVVVVGFFVFGNVVRTNRETIENILFLTKVNDVDRQGKILKGLQW